MPTIIARGVGFTHIQVFTNTIGTAELVLTSLHCGPICDENGEVTFVSVLRQCVFRPLPDKSFVLIKMNRQFFSFGRVSFNNDIGDDFLGFIVPQAKRNAMNSLEEDLRNHLQKTDEMARAMITFDNPSDYSQLFMMLMPIMTEILCCGIFIVELPKCPNYFIVAKVSERVKFKSYRERLEHAHKKRLAIKANKRSWTKRQLLKRLAGKSPFKGV